MIRNLGYAKLSKTGSHRRSMLSNMAASLILTEQIRTTVAKAKALRRVVDNVITDAKKGDYSRVRMIIRDKKAYHKTFDVMAPRYKDRPGGFTRVLRAGFRKGDWTEVAIVKLVQ